MEQKRIKISSGAPWESIVGYTRAVRIGNLIEVSGTTATRDGQLVGKGDMYLQTKTCLEIIIEAIEKAGGKKEDIVRTRVYITDISKWDEAGKAHGEFFSELRPASTLLQVAGLIHPDMLVEVEATAVVGSYP
jgi:enamine deaminase RidA (YjgF/YER057c/UK114 family)